MCRDPVQRVTRLLWLIAFIMAVNCIVTFIK